MIFTWDRVTIIVPNQHPVQAPLVYIRKIFVFEGDNEKRNVTLIPKACNTIVPGESPSSILLLLCLAYVLDLNDFLEPVLRRSTPRR